MRPAALRCAAVRFMANRGAVLSRYPYRCSPGSAAARPHPRAAAFLGLDAPASRADTGRMATNSRNKGASGEREAAAAFEAATGIPCYRSAQRIGKHGDADLQCGAAIHLESKRYARIAALDFLRQAEREAQTGRVPVAIMREDGDTEWAVVVRVRDVVAFANAIADARRNPLL